jgi:hypothetical protein
LCAFIIALIRATCPAHFTLLDLMTPTLRHNIGFICILDRNTLCVVCMYVHSPVTNNAWTSPQAKFANPRSGDSPSLHV